MVYREATTVVGPIATSQGGDNLMVATHGDVTMEGTEEPGVTQDPGDALSHIAEVYREATTVMGPIATSQGGDNLVVATHGDVLMEGTEEPDVTNCSGDALGHVAEVYREATTVVGPIATSQGGDKVMVATHGDVLMEGTERPGVTQDLGDTLGHVAEVYSEATTVVGPIATSQGGDNLMRATTVAGPIATSQGGDNLVVGTHGDETMEGTERPGVTNCSGDTLGHVAEVLSRDTTTEGPVPTSQGGDNLMVATHGDVLVEGTAQPGATQDPGDTLGRVTMVYRDATTVVGPIATSQGGDNLMVATHGDVLME
ncbi:hypothetical protein QYF61_004972, partial [Mycteria americana]